MSRSRKSKRKGQPKCICGKFLVNLFGRGHFRGCPTLDYVHERNEQFLKYRERRSQPLTEED